MQRRWQEQIILETKAVEASAERYKREMLSAQKRRETASMPPARRLLMQWFKPLTLAIQEEQRKVRVGWLGWGGHGAGGVWWRVVGLRCSCLTRWWDWAAVARHAHTGHIGKEGSAHLGHVPRRLRQDWDCLGLQATAICTRLHCHRRCVLVL